jgi:hypothetical protein
MNFSALKANVSELRVVSKLREIADSIGFVYMLYERLRTGLIAGSGGGEGFDAGCQELWDATPPCHKLHKETSYLLPYTTYVVPIRNQLLFFIRLVYVTHNIYLKYTM